MSNLDGKRSRQPERHRTEQRTQPNLANSRARAPSVTRASVGPGSPSASNVR
jgi:hypothetical protein